MNVNAFNNNIIYQQFVIQFNQIRNDLINSRQITIVFQIDFDQQQVAVNFKKRQMKMSSNALREKMKSRFRTKKCHREKIKNVQTLIIMITRLTKIIIKKLKMILDEKIDVYIILNDLKMITDRAVDYND